MKLRIVDRKGEWWQRHCDWWWQSVTEFPLQFANTKGKKNVYQQQWHCVTRDTVWVLFFPPLLLCRDQTAAAEN